uniref:Uncharacterized protein n=1 Tax=Siphoviridae sp. ctzpQ31 TaxID=2823613 RepID=A0A8S5L8A0_9CAUD|nr:MAG TPA: hypothetical protein [Siphoviridae sp. ctzpQ31]DAY03666.1 MAG TPA: hypothetical protein [Bacteriophage sp.]
MEHVNTPGDHCIFFSNTQCSGVRMESALEKSLKLSRSKIGRATEVWHCSTD